MGARLRLTIRALDLDQIDVARQFDISPSKLGNWLRDVNYPEILFLINFCERHNLSMDWLLRGLVAGVAGPLGDVLWKLDVGSVVEAQEQKNRQRDIVSCS